VIGVRKRSIDIPPGRHLRRRGTRYPMIRQSTDSVVIEGSLCSCAGGVSVVNLMTAMIR